ncbi:MULTISPECIES: tRNA (guanosine(37)-N1)-methyltransferase TrmD [unclassified Sedimentibacter]|uniref:tRNA (guanosine(37)-N1)-methyltransferase TrmD n=1 Tax=unclassified Sedimentibacter TaxID=2649220 RepID=UPI001BD4A683|nr:tRNA (guanosine(37)-N1)-methyltransferase TrmD [Sedimentibacter sp. MB35-C1]WMJ76289.1 tRNA (guanosine(37)-N1)-methyltransferase TrmD [Sedimentibacter sp. MB35-C1]
MRFDIVTLFPELIDIYTRSGIIGRAVENGMFEIGINYLRDYSEDKHKKVDDYPYGGGPGMLLKPEPMFKALDSIKKHNSYIIYLSPKGNLFSQKKAKELSEKEHIVLIAGHYEGIDQRIIDKYVDEEISMGDYVLTSGELPALMIVDAVGRLLPGVLGSDESSVEESHSNNLLEYPQYTRPESYLGMDVPDILLSGHHKKIEEWRRFKQIEITLERRPDMIKDKNIIEEYNKLSRNYK